MKHFQLISLFSALGLLATACSGESDPEANLDRFESAESFHVISCANGGHAVSSASVKDGVRYEFAFNDDERLVTFTIRNFSVLPNEAPADYTFVDVPWVYSIGTPDVQRIINVESLSPTTPSGAPHTLSDVHIVYCEPKKSSAYENRGVVASYTVDGIYHVQVYPYTVMGEGTTVCFNTSTGESRICYSTSAEIKFDPHTLLSTVEVKGLLPDDAHPQMSFTLNNVSTEFVDGGYLLSEPSVMTIEGGEISSFNGNAAMSDELYLEFMLKLTDGTEYNVECHLSPNLTPQNM